MKPSQIFTWMAAGLSLTPGVHAVLGTSCLSAASSLHKVPGRFLEKSHEYACQAGCQPKPAHWRKYGKEFISGLVEDGASFCQIDSPEGKDALIQYLDAKYTEVLGKCEPKLSNSHVCDESEESNEFQKCISSSGRQVPSGGMVRLLPHISEERCKKVDEYLNSEKLWEEHFPARGKTYIEHCHQEL